MLKDNDSPMQATDGQAGGPFTKRAQASLSEVHDGADVLLTTSCTAALEMAAILAGVGVGDTVIVPSFGFVTTALAFVRAGATVRFADIDEERLGLDPGSVAALLDETVKAIVPIHYGGVACRIDEISELASAAGATLIEDNAHGLFGRHRGRPLGTFGSMATLSFHATKNISCGEGGALVINDASLLDRAQVVLEKGTNRRAFLQGAVDKYTWRDLGSSFGLSDYLAAILLERLEEADVEQKRRSELAAAYDDGLADAPGLRTLIAPEGDVHAHHLYPVVLDDASVRDATLDALRTAGITASFHYVPLHETPAGARYGEAPLPCPVAETVAAALVRLPMGQDVSADEATRAAGILRSLVGGGAS